MRPGRASSTTSRAPAAPWTSRPTPAYEVAIFYHEEDSYLMRFANSAISLNTNEHLIRVEAIAFDGKKRASYEMITNLDEVETMKSV